MAQNKRPVCSWPFQKSSDGPDTSTQDTLMSQLQNFEPRGKPEPQEQARVSCTDLFESQEALGTRTMQELKIGERASGGGGQVPLSPIHGFKSPPLFKSPSTGKMWRAENVGKGGPLGTPTKAFSSKGGPSAIVHCDMTSHHPRIVLVPQVANLEEYVGHELEQERESRQENQRKDKLLQCAVGIASSLGKHSNSKFLFSQHKILTRIV